MNVPKRAGGLNPSMVVVVAPAFEAICKSVKFGVEAWFALSACP
jgi:hypothetical protein